MSESSSSTFPLIRQWLLRSSIELLNNQINAFKNISSSEISRYSVDSFYSSLKMIQNTLDYFDHKTCKSIDSRIQKLLLVCTAVEDNTFKYIGNVIEDIQGLIIKLENLIQPTCSNHLINLALY